MSDFQKFMAYKMTTEGTGGSNGCAGCVASVTLALDIITLLVFIFI